MAEHGAQGVGEHDPAARRALRAHQEARLIALNAEAKIGRVAELLERHRADVATLLEAGLAYRDFTAPDELVRLRAGGPCCFR